MDKSWVSIKRRFLSPGQNGEEHEEMRQPDEVSEAEPRPSAAHDVPPAPTERPRQAFGGDSLDATGRQNEMIRVGMAQVLERLDELTKLKDDFSALIIDPVSTLITDYPLVQSKLLDAEEILKREQDGAAAARRELRELTVSYEKLTDEFAVTSSQLQHATTALRDNEGQVESLSTALREQEQRVGDLERQLGTERERVRVISEELQAVRTNAQEADAAVGRLERDLAEARETIEILEFDNQALRSTSSEQSQRLAALDIRYIELEQQGGAAQEQVAELQTKLEAEHQLRKKLEAQLDAERTGARVEIAALEMKVEGTTSRMGVTEKILAHAREQLREKTDELKAAERAVKEALIEKNSIERRLETLQQDLDRQTATATESNQARTELGERCEMLTKAIAAKESLLQRADHRTGMLLDRIDQLTRKFEDERNGLEAKNKKLWEELQREKSERALAQGALETARRGRTELEREFAKVQRQRRPNAGNDGSAETGSDQPSQAPDREPPTNVMAFKTPDPDEGRPGQS